MHPASPLSPANQTLPPAPTMLFLTNAQEKVIMCNQPARTCQPDPRNPLSIPCFPSTLSSQPDLPCISTRLPLPVTQNDRYQPLPSPASLLSTLIRLYPVSQPTPLVTKYHHVTPCQHTYTLPQTLARIYKPCLTPPTLPANPSISH